MKIYHTQNATSYSNWIEGAESTKNINEADLIIFTGGADVSPFIYDELHVHPNTGMNSNRDVIESRLFDKALKKGIPMLGICRGSQFLCAKAGGKLVQDQNNPSFTHKMKTYDGKEFMVTSTHHQAQHPFNLPEEDYRILGWSEDLIQYRKDGQDKEMDTPLDCEVVYYPKYNALAIQSHPEMTVRGGKIDKGFEESIEWFRDVVRTYLGL